MSILRRILFKVALINKMIGYKINYGKRIKVGSNFSFRRGFNLNISSDNASITIGNNVFFNNDCSLNCKKGINIGDDCIFGESVKIYDHNHIFKSKETVIRRQGYSCSMVKIGNNCWIGSNVVILPGGVLETTQ